MLKGTIRAVRQAAQRGRIVAILGLIRQCQTMGPVEIVPYSPSEAVVFLRLERYGLLGTVDRLKMHIQLLVLRHAVVPRSTA